MDAGDSLWLFVDIHFNRLYRGLRGSDIRHDLSGIAMPDQASVSSGEIPAENIAGLRKTRQPLLSANTPRSSTKGVAKDTA
ncbi:hypothetical protein WJ542_13775 [Paraburkholderia sp. B3]|uniref:hypothetical protein n=1 Tax=Paraburkholderia sp. B3 TaxID=3134791 RepID=UPI003981BEB2